MSHAGRASLGGDREIALACFAAARLAAGMLPPLSLASTDSAARAGAAKVWLASQSLPAPTRGAVIAVIDAVADGKFKGVAAGLKSLADAVRTHLDAGSIQEIEILAAEVGQPPLPV